MEDYLEDLINQSYEEYDDDNEHSDDAEEQ